MCLPHVTEHIVEGLQRRTFLGFVGGRGHGEPRPGRGGDGRTAGP
jgi:hypothetical protein